MSLDAGTGISDSRVASKGEMVGRLLLALSVSAGRWFWASCRRADVRLLYNGHQAEAMAVAAPLIASCCSTRLMQLVVDDGGAHWLKLVKN